MLASDEGWISHRPAAPFQAMLANVASSARMQGKQGQNDRHPDKMAWATGQK